MSEQQVEWKEHQVHTTEQSQQEEEEEEEAAGFDLFANNELEVFELEFPGLPTLAIKGQSECTQSTGLGLWMGGDVIVEYLLKDNHASLIRNKRVLELGSGVGLCGLVAYHLGASQVVLTDGDTSVLENLRFNISQNVYERETKEEPIITCTQLIWGRDAQSILARHQQPQVIIAADCLYMKASVKPFWWTVDQLLDPDGVLVYTMIASSTAPPGMVLQVAKEHGFSRKEVAKDVYLFRREPTEESNR